MDTGYKMFDQSIFTGLIVFTSSVLIGSLMIFFSKPMIKNKRHDLQAVQAAHVTPVPRIGGIAIVCALILSLAFQFGDAHQANLSSKLLLSTVPIFFIGLSEDLGLLASPRIRILAAAASGTIFIWLFGEWLPRADFPGLNLAIQWAPFAIVLSIFLTVGISHAFNLIDGLNGLAGSTALAVAFALAAIAHQAGLTDHRDILLIFAAAILGFLVFNFPYGKIFLGDAGAYAIGHLLVWMSVSILWNAPNVTPFAILLIFFGPVADTLLAITRRLSLGKPIAQPDRLHFHQLVMRGVEIVLLGRKKRWIANPLATLFTLPFIFAPIIAGVLLALDHSNAAIACAVFAAMFITSYKTGLWLAPKLRRSACPKGPRTSNIG